MQLDRHVALVAIMVGVGATACGGSVEVSSGSSAGSDSGGAGGSGGAPPTSGPGGAGGDTSTGGALPQGFCAGACVTTADAGCFPTADCTAYCDAHAPDWTSAIGAAFAKCAAENPLCFESVEGCILGELHPAGSKVTVRLDGSGLDAYDGKVLTVWNDPGTGVPFGGEVVLAGGQFHFEWVEPVPASASGGALLLMYIDMDGDEACTAAGDITSSLFTEWNGDYLAPVFSATIAPPLNDPDFVCDFPPGG